MPSPLILVLARRMWNLRRIPPRFRQPLADGRLLVLSPVPQSIRRVDARSTAFEIHMTQSSSEML